MTQTLNKYFARSKIKLIETDLSLAAISVELLQ